MQNQRLVEWWTAARKRIQKEDRQCFDTLVILTRWILWKERNNRTFDRSVKTLPEIVAWVADEIASWFQAGFRRLEPLARALGRLPGRVLITM